MTEPLEPGLAILVWSASDQDPARCVTPLMLAQTARALDMEVELHFAGPAVALLQPSLAASLYPTATAEKSLLDHLNETLAAGVRIFACAMARQAYLPPGAELLDEVRAAGITAFTVRSVEPGWRSLVF